MYHDQQEGDECEQFNVVNRGMCKAPLGERGECPRQLEHGDEFDVPDDGFRASGARAVQAALDRRP